MAKDYVKNFIKESSLVEMNTYWKTIKEKHDLDESRGFASKDYEKINENVTF